MRCEDEVDKEVSTADGVESSVLSLALEAERRIVSVISNSRALGSSNAANFPIAGRHRTWCLPIIFPMSSVTLWKILQLTSEARLCQKPPWRPWLEFGTSIVGTGSRWNVADKPVSKNDSRFRQPPQSYKADRIQ